MIQPIAIGEPELSAHENEIVGTAGNIQCKSSVAA
jgi:hypothetical protein